MTSGKLVSRILRDVSDWISELESTDGKTSKSLYDYLVKEDNEPKKEKPKRNVFELGTEQEKKYEDWRRNHDCKLRKDGIRYVGASGGADIFHITGTGLGLVVEVECACGEKLDLSEDF